MTLWFIRLATIIAFPIIGWYKVSDDWRGIAVGVGVALLIIAVEIFMEHVPLTHLLFGLLGGGLGLIFAVLINEFVLILHSQHLADIMDKAAPYVYIVLTYLGAIIAVRRQQEVDRLDRGELPIKGGLKRKTTDIRVVDTSAIIDGRIADVYETRFLSGTIVVGKFILKELQDISDSSDTLKRGRGRRGLDILKRLQEHGDIQVKIYEKDYPEIKDVDGKLVSLAKELDAAILTTDFNLNKVASLQGVTVLNVNDLANALRPAVLPGEAMTIFVAKEGKEKEQGVGYLDDGTMVIVEEGRRLVGKKVDVTVTSVLQTSAGRMIFTKSRDGGRDRGNTGSAS
jgi:uncharacterized protein YacL